MSQDQDDLIAQRNEAVGSYAPGGYLCHCRRCASVFKGDKRAVVCRGCAITQDEISRLQAALESAQARVGELEYWLASASDAMRMTALAMESPLGRVTKKHVIHWTSMFHQESQAIRRILLPSAPPPATEGGAS